MEYKQSIKQDYNQEKPIEYSVGFSNFLGCRIDLRYKPFIPEIETAFWVKKAINQIKKSNPRIKSLKILDIFAGSGCIGIAILKHLKNSRVVFAEVDKDFIRQIKLNLRLNKIDSRKYKVIKSDVFKGIPKGFDYIFANPPYVPLRNKHLVQELVLGYEPLIALFGGEDGLLFIGRFLKDARKYLKPGGKIFMEFDYLRKWELENLLKKLNYKNYRIYKDQFKKWRWICIKC